VDKSNTVAYKDMMITNFDSCKKEEKKDILPLPKLRDAIIHRRFKCKMGLVVGDRMMGLSFSELLPSNIPVT
jgi:hypothetical protein